PVQALALDARSVLSDRLLTIWFARLSCFCLELFGTVSLEFRPLPRLHCGPSPRSSCRPFLMAAPYPPPGQETYLIGLNRPSGRGGLGWLRVLRDRVEPVSNPAMSVSARSP